MFSSELLPGLGLSLQDQECNEVLKDCGGIFPGKVQRKVQMSLQDQECNEP